jgi:Ca-activated chloride channel homolog
VQVEFVLVAAISIDGTGWGLNLFIRHRNEKDMNKDAPSRIKDSQEKETMSVSRVLLAFGTLACVGGLLAWAAKPQQVQPPIGQPFPRPPHPPHILPPPRPLPSVAVSSVDVDAKIAGGVAAVTVSHLFANRSPVAQEGDFVFPIPDGATIREFAMYDGETKLDARLMGKDEATATYEAIVRQRRDPALLTYVGRSALRVRLFPIAPNSERRVTLKLAIVLPREGGNQKFGWTLAGPHLPVKPEKVTVRLNAEGVGGVYSPTHDLQIRKEEGDRAVITWSSEKAPGALTEHPELEVYLSPKDTRAVALSVLTYNASLPQVASLGGGMRQSGYFMVVATPNLPDSAKVTGPKRVILVMDRSGSMAGKKIEQARGALKVALGKLRPIDSFNLLTFSDKVEKLAPEPLTASPDNLKRAMAWADDMTADGGTNIHQALIDGLAQFDERRAGNTLLFFTDGLPTVGERDQSQIVKAAMDASQKKARCFVFGVGYDVDVPFLDTVSSKLRGDADYVRPDEDIEVKTAQFVAKTAAPSLENLKLTMNGVRSGEVYPKPDELPDLFDGGQLVLVGRYTGEGKTQITLTGEAGGKPQSFTLGSNLPAVATEADFLPRLWASRKIGYLQDEIRLMEEGPRKKEAIEQVVALSREFGILTPFTALFVPEPGMTLDRDNRLFLGVPGSPGGGGRGAGGFGGGAPAPAVSAAKAAYGGLRAGEDANNVSQGARAQRASNQVSNSDYVLRQSGALKDAYQNQAQRLRRVAGRTFWQNGPLWQDAGYDPKKQTELVKIKPFSEAYFALTRRSKPFAQWAAVGQAIIVVNAKQAVALSDDGKETLTDREADALVSGVK